MRKASLTVGLGACVRRSLKNAGTWRGTFEPSVRCAFSRNENVPPDTGTQPYRQGSFAYGWVL